MSGVVTVSRGRLPPQVVPTMFVWSHGGQQVHLCGTFTSWQSSLPMSPVEGSPSVFQVTCNLPIGYYEYKFIVDGEWRHDPQGSFTCDRNGNANNWLIVKGNDAMDVDLPSPEHVHPIPVSDIETSKQRIAEFLLHRTAYELIPESGKVIALDVTLPVKQAFHVLYEQGVSVAPLWDLEKQQFVGMLSASDFIIILRQLGNLGSVLSEEELDTHTIGIWKKEKMAISRYPETMRGKPLVYVTPDDSLRQVADKLLLHGVATVPVLYHTRQDGLVPQLLHLASLSDVMKCIWRHFRNVSSCLPVFLQPICTLPIGTWNPQLGVANSRPLAMIHANACLSNALSLLLQAGVSALPVLDDNDSLIDVYTRSDITALAKDKTYTKVHLDEITVAQALKIGADARNVAGASAVAHCQMCLRSNTLRDIVERLALPGVRRVICVEAGSRHVEGIISLKDMFKFLLA